MDKGKIIACLDVIQQQIDIIREEMSSSDPNNSMPADRFEILDANNQQEEKLEEQPKPKDIVLSRAEQFRERIGALLKLAASQKSEEEIVEGLREVIHSDTSSNSLALGRLQRFNFSRLQQQYAQYLQDGNDFDSFLIEREQKGGFSDIIEYKVFVLADARKPVPLTFRFDPKTDRWMIYSFSL